MEIRIYNENLEFKGIIENHSSLLWNRKYSDVGNFELHAPLTEENVRLLKPDNLVWVRGNKEAGVIENLFYEENSDKQKMVVKGRFLESYFERRITKQTKNYNDKAESVMRSLLSSCVAIPKVTISPLKGYSEKVILQATYKNLLSLLKKVSKSSTIGFRLVPDFKTKTLVFETYKGEDKSLLQSERNRVIFSEEYNNLNSSQYTFSNQANKTFAIVGGEGEGENRIIVTVGEGSGLFLKETFVDARDLRSEGMSDQNYQELLKQRGREALRKSGIVESVECDILPEGNFVYKTHYDLGDIVSIRKKSWGVLKHLRITEIQEIYEQSHVTIVPVFGNPLPDTIERNDSISIGGASSSSGGMNIDLTTILAAIYPVGSIYMSTSNVSPQILFGGTWVPIKDRFLLSSGDTYHNTETGGEAEHTLTIEEMPSHSHKSNIGWGWSSTKDDSKARVDQNSPKGLFGDVSATGGNQPHNNMPPYLVVNVWKRTA